MHAVVASKEARESDVHPFCLPLASDRCVTFGLGFVVPQAARRLRLLQLCIPFLHLQVAAIQAQGTNPKNRSNSGCRSRALTIKKVSSLDGQRCGAGQCLVGGHTVVAAVQMREAPDSSQRHVTIHSSGWQASPASLENVVVLALQRLAEANDLCGRVLASDVSAVRGAWPGDKDERRGCQAGCCLAGQVGGAAACPLAQVADVLPRQGPAPRVPLIRPSLMSNTSRFKPNMSLSCRRRGDPQRWHQVATAGMARACLGLCSTRDVGIASVTDSMCTR